MRMSPEHVYFAMVRAYGTPERALDQLLAKVEEHDHAFLSGKPMDIEGRNVAQQIYNIVNSVYTERLTEQFSNQDNTTGDN
jgi:hypothetical protein